VATVGAADAGEAMLGVSTLEKPADRLGQDRSPVADLSGVALGVDGAKVVEVFADEAVEIGFQWLARR